MAMELVSFGVQKLWYLLSQEFTQFQGVADQVIELKSDLNMLQSFLKDADAKKHTSELVRNCVEEINEIVFDASDILESFLLKEKIGKGSGIKHIGRLFCAFPGRRETALDIGGIIKRISKVIHVMQSFGVQQIIANGGYMQHLHDRQREMRQTFSRDYENDLLGLEENIKKLVKLTVEEDNVQLVSITGMGGVGKTTLARQVFNHEMVKLAFDGLAWVCVSQEFTRKSVWQTILRNLKPAEEEKNIMEMTESTLQGELFRLLETSKSLIVFDDIWKEDDWDVIKQIFPPKKEWMVLLTSRNEGVATRGDTPFINFKPECLNNQDSWTLFERIAFPRKDTSELKIDEKMREMGKQMIKHCGGLPLAIKVLGGLLAPKYTLHDWILISENIGSHIVGRTTFNYGNNSSAYHVLSLSFEALPSYLKHCFLYLAHYPEDYEIDVEKLSYYLAVEGIVNYDKGTIRDVADGYIEELVRRNMVIAKRDITTSRFESCHLHDMMREVCLFKANEENFLQIIGVCSLTLHCQSLSRSRRLVFHYPTTLHVERDIKNPKVRSLLIIYREHWLLSRSHFVGLQLLRLLDLSFAIVEGGNLPTSIGKLIHLRYLSLKGADVSHLPSSLQNLKLLIYLNLDVILSPTFYMPNVFMDMRELRYLALPGYMHNNTKLELSNLVNLETLKNFSTRYSNVEDLRGMVRLRTLKIYFYDKTSIETLSSSIGGLRYMENLDIVDCRSKRLIEEEFGLEFMHLKHLMLSIYMPRLPHEQCFPSYLTTLSLTECRLEKDPMPILEKLFHLIKVNLRWRSFCGRRMVCLRSGFPQLEELGLSGLEEWQEWMIEEGSMPRLRTLSINDCKKLKELPDGLKFIISLKQLYTSCMVRGWEESISKEGKDYYKVQHISYINFKRN